MRLWHNMPTAALLLLALAVAVIIVVIARPRLRRARRERFIRNLPPPPVRVVKEVELKLPRRNDVDEPPPAATE